MSQHIKNTAYRYIDNKCLSLFWLQLGSFHVFLWKCALAFLFSLFFTCWGEWWCIWRPGSWRKETSSQSLVRPAGAQCSPRFLTQTDTRGENTEDVLQTFFLGSRNYTLETKGWDGAKSSSNCTQTHSSTNICWQPQYDCMILAGLTRLTQESLTTKTKTDFIKITAAKREKEVEGLFTELNGNTSECCMHFQSCSSDGQYSDISFWSGGRDLYREQWKHRSL